MDRSFNKSIAVNELNYIFQSSSIEESERSRLIPELFEDPKAERIYLLKDNIRTLKDLEAKIRLIINQQDSVTAMLHGFSVKDDLCIPHGLRDTFLGNVKMAFFVGAGASKLLKIPLWEEIADQAIDHMKEHNYINHSEAMQLKNERYTARQVISIFHQIVKDKSRKLFYERCLAGKSNDKGNPYELLFLLEQALAKPITKITTNIDLEWENILKDETAKQKQRQSFEGKIIDHDSYYENAQRSDFKRGQEIEHKILYQIHGSLRDLDNSIMTTSQYVNAYRDENGLKGFLEDIFSTHIVLFIGSGFQEFEILEHCLKHSPSRHYALVGTQMGEDNLFRVKKAYFSELNIKAISYYLDFQGYDRLLLVLRSWVDEITSHKKKQFYDDIRLIDEAL